MPAAIHQKTLDAIQQFKLCQPGDFLIVGVSGGADSVALLDLLATLPDFPLHLIVAHLNHCLRGDESDGDQQFVQQLAAHYQLPCELRRSDVRQLAQQQRSSLEEAGRTARYAFFNELRTKYRASAVAVAHHVDDQAETLLLRLLRGAGTTGLAAMAPVNPAGIIRPLLGISRQELRKHLTDRRLTFREDSSNSDQAYLRNRIRHELLPLLQEYNPAIAQRLSATASLLGEDETLLAHCTATTFQQLSRSGSGWNALSLSGLRQQPRPLRQRLYRKAIESLLGNLHRFELRHYQLLDNLLLESSTGASLNLPCRLIAMLTADQLLFAPQALLQPAPPCSGTIDGPGRYELGNGLTLTIEQTQPPLSWQGLNGTTSYVDPVQAPFPWQVRPIAPGDRLELLGSKGSRSLQDLLTDLKIPRYLRPCLPLICQDNRPLWLAGIRRSRHALVNPDQQQTIRITLSGQDQLPLFP
ncbi:tRNA(Ile)-lysidine synthase [Trichlorobacter thiogenes]|uniref:tRNA(Ile)-lysidine synthase n=1 Tax=Trichlorobacter thiogenes TaxID=115783 RepID=A0A1T4NC84_9BACT|nr:tRNA lysidine(34) synthetase TilS [Trichlorobacter thiogenes]SJZ76745.1 tRNA(Ile)-lysidine synthase [Trichlorobacter thiogenes]